MAGDQSRDQQVNEIIAEAVDLLRSFELTEYEAKCLIALIRIGQGSAKDVSNVADVPQARVYDCMDTLQSRGLVDIQQSTPRQFRAVSPEVAVDSLRRQATHQLDQLAKLLPRLEAPADREQEGTIWVTQGSTQVGERMEQLISEAREDILLAIAVEDLLTDELLAGLETAAARGVEITIGSPAEPIRDKLHETIPRADVRETWTWWETYPIQSGAVSAILMIDGASLLVSSDVDSTLPGVQDHRAVWSTDNATPLVGMMRPLFANAITGSAPADS